MSETFGIPPIYPSSLYFFPSLCFSLLIPSCSWREPEVHLSFLRYGQTGLRQLLLLPRPAGKWRLLQKFEMPIWRGISSKGQHAPFLTHLANTEVNQVAGHRTSLLNKRQARVEPCCAVGLKVTHLQTSECWILRGTK